jgi:GT2 family glycosyltransferase
VEVIVVAYGAPALLRAALEPVRALPVIVVDNSSLPEIAALCAEFGVRYVDARGNRGFGAGVNLGLQHRQLPGADVLLLNPDAVVSPAQIDALHATLRSDSALASIAPEQTDAAGKPSRVQWPFPSPRNAWLEAVGLGRFEGRGTFVIGAVLLLRAEALAQVGGFDERFFLYAEETDWAYRAHLLGWRHDVARGVHALHEGGATSTDGRVRDARFHASQERYLRKHFGSTGWQVARAGAWLGAVVRSALLRGARRDEARRRAALYRLGPVRVEARIAPRE